MVRKTRMRSKRSRRLTRKTGGRRLTRKTGGRRLTRKKLMYGGSSYYKRGERLVDTSASDTVPEADATWRGSGPEHERAAAESLAKVLGDKKSRIGPTSVGYITNAMVRARVELAGLREQITTAKAQLSASKGQDRQEQKAVYNEQKRDRKIFVARSEVAKQCTSQLEEQQLIFTAATEKSEREVAERMQKLEEKLREEQWVQINKNLELQREQMSKYNTELRKYEEDEEAKRKELTEKIRVINSDAVGTKADLLVCRRQLLSRERRIARAREERALMPIVEAESISSDPI